MTLMANMYTSYACVCVRVCVYVCVRSYVMCMCVHVCMYVLLYYNNIILCILRDMSLYVYLCV